MASTSKVAISNAALTLLKGNTITSMDETRPEARYCNQFFDDALDELLGEHQWSFAIERATLSQSAESPAFGYTYKYTLPTSPLCLSVVSIYDKNAVKVEPTEYRIEGKYLLSDNDELYIKYVGRVSDYTLLPPVFRMALEYNLAAKLAHPITGSTNLVGFLTQQYEKYLRYAKTADNKQDEEVTWNDNDFPYITARFS